MSVEEAAAERNNELENHSHREQEAEQMRKTDRETCRNSRRDRLTQQHNKG